MPKSVSYPKLARKPSSLSMGAETFFGEGCLTVAITDCVIMRLDKAVVVRILRDEPKFSALFMSYILARNARVEEDLVDQLFNSSKKRLARVLLLMANFGQEGRPEPVIAKVSQETLAEMVGTTRSRVRRPLYLARIRERPHRSLISPPLSL